MLLSALAAAALLAGCGGDGGDKAAPKGFGGSSTSQSASAPATEYPAPVVKNFMEACSKQSGATTSYCRCTIEELQKRLPYDDFKQADAAIQRGEKEPAKARRAIQAAIAKCRKPAG